ARIVLELLLRFLVHGPDEEVVRIELFKILRREREPIHLFRGLVSARLQAEARQRCGIAETDALGPGRDELIGLALRPQVRGDIRWASLRPVDPSTSLVGPAQRLADPPGHILPTRTA